LSCRALKERAQLVVGATRLKRRGFRESLEQSRYGSDVLTRPSEEWGTLVVFKDPPVYVAGIGTCVPAAFVTSDLTLKFGMFLL
jgi:hypothetical protein